jgi:predicted PurR-regulated permease PerM
MPTANPTRYQIAFYAFVTALVAVLAFFVFEPYITPVFLAIVFAVVFHPLHRFMKRRIASDSWSAAATLSVIVVAILIPALFISTLLFQEATSLYASLSSGPETGLLAQVTGAIEGRLSTLFPSTTVDIAEYLNRGLSWAVSNLGAFFSSFFSLIITLLLMLLSLFYFLRDGQTLLARLISLSPLSDKYDERLIKKLEAAVNSVIRGSLIIALIQGVLSGLGMAIFQVPNPVLWGTLAAVAALIPNLGTSLVLLPAIIYLGVAGEAWQAFGLLIWGIAFVGIIDNVLAPALIQRGIAIHPFLILLSVLGGIGFFGPVGFVAGPLILAFLVALVEMYPLIVKHA